MIDVKSSSLTGAAGEHLVMSRLLSRGYIAALAPQGVLTYDIVVTSADGANLCAFQVKTSWDKGADRGWHMQEKHEHIVSSSLYYAFVDLGRDETATPAVYVMHSACVARVVRTTYRAWLRRRGKNGQRHKPTKLRRINLDFRKICGPAFPLTLGWMDRYRENWAQIAMPAAARPVSDGDPAAAAA